MEVSQQQNVERVMSQCLNVNFVIKYTLAEPYAVHYLRLFRDSPNVVVVAIPQSYYEVTIQSIRNQCLRNYFRYTQNVSEMDRTQVFFCIL